MTKLYADSTQVAERRYLLEMFLRKLSKFDFIINGPECQLFFRSGDADVGPQLKKIPDLSTQEKYERIKEVVPE